MEITEIRIKLMGDSDDRLQAFCSITFDDSFVIRDLKIIEGLNGPFVAMPSRKLTSHCPDCKCKNHLRAAYCNQCGSRLKEDRAIRDQEGRAKLYADIAHPINSACREMIQDCVIAEYQAELERSKQPGYVSRYDDDFMGDEGPADDADSHHEPPSRPRSSDRTHIQPPASPAQGPHKAPPHKSSEQHKTDDPKNGAFGVGIF